MSLRTEISCIPLGNKWFINDLNVNSVPHPPLPPQKKKKKKKKLHTNREVNMLLLTGKIGKAYNFRNFFCLIDRRNSRHFFSNWEPGAQPKLAHTYYVFPVWMTNWSWPICNSQLQGFVVNFDWFTAVLWRNVSGRCDYFSFTTALKKQLAADQGQ